MINTLSKKSTTIITLTLLIIGFLFLLNYSNENTISDRNGVQLAWAGSGDESRQYVGEQGFSYLITSIESLEDKGNRTLSIDSELQAHTYKSLEEIATRAEYKGGAGIVMDIKTGEILTITSYPEFELGTQLDEDKELPIDRSVHGSFIPGSTIKPFVALGALHEGIIDPEKEILSTGSIEVLNPLQDGKYSVFRDWKAHGYVDMKEAIGVSSNVYFYEIGGGFDGQEGLGIERLETYIRMFGLGQKTGIDLISESEGTIPNPSWKEQNFNGDAWRIGDTYLASIGQHGYEVTPLQLVRATAAIASRGTLVTPTLLLNKKPGDENTILPIKGEHFDVVMEGMEYAVTNGTASGLYLDDFTLAAKTGTAEVDDKKEFIDSWIVGYFPHDEPRYAFAFMLERGPWGEETGAVAAAEEIFKWIRKNRPEFYN